MEGLKNKWIILDTNVLSPLIKFVDKDFWIAFLTQLEELNCVCVRTEFIEFELERVVQSEKDGEAFEEYISKVTEKLPGLDHKKLWKDAAKIASVLHHYKKSPNVVDCLIGAALKKYESNLFVATFNNKDFPLVIYDRISCIARDVGDEPNVLGIYKFSSEKYKQAYDKFAFSKGASYKKE